MSELGFGNDFFRLIDSAAVRSGAEPA